MPIPTLYTLPTLHILAPGLLSTVQDLGRPGLRAQGVPPGGALDTDAAQIANLLVGNAPGDAVLETTLLGPTMAVLQDTVAAVCGADFALFLDNVPVPLWHSFPIYQGQILRFGRRRGGARAYVALRGGIAVPVVLGSRSTLLAAGFGGLAGRALRAGDILETYADADAALPNHAGRGLRPADIPPVAEHAVLRLLLGPQDDLLTPAARDTLLSAVFEVSAQSSRMGLRLHGPPLALRAGLAGTLPSEGVASGAVQVAGGQALLLLADCGTAGGYPVAGVVVAADLCAAAQCAPGTTILFQSVLLSEAHAAEQVRCRFLRVLACGADRQRSPHPSCFRTIPPKQHTGPLRMARQRNWHLRGIDAAFHRLSKPCLTTEGFLPSLESRREAVWTVNESRRAAQWLAWNLQGRGIRTGGGLARIHVIIKRERAAGSAKALLLLSRHFFCRIFRMGLLALPARVNLVFGAAAGGDERLFCVYSA